ncbi:MAG: (d)CMP kinase [Victivallales bacterium]|jgi:CMP/dCMP kinase|nr:(d)CMP kinase [Victivallales bacterium]MBT7303559.1 (d)CMP kinase [Victivallales bacterium]
MAGVQIAIDGPAASGKSTVAKLVAAALGGFYINTGDMYRAVTRAVLDAGIDADVDPAAAVSLLAKLDLRYRVVAGAPLLHLNGEPVQQESIRGPEVAGVVSFVARIAGVRDWLRERQRETRELGIIVMEGRDIGTVIFPDAAHKFFMTASPEVRAQRRLDQAGEVADGATLASVTAEIAERDRIDSTRKVAPLRPADDAIHIDTDALTPRQVADWIVARVRGEAA